MARVKIIDGKKLSNRIYFSNGMYNFYFDNGIILSVSPSLWEITPYSCDHCYQEWKPNAFHPECCDSCGAPI